MENCFIVHWKQSP